MKVLAFLLLFLVLMAGAAAWFVYVPFGPQAETFVEIPTGTGSSAIATRLERAGTIRSRYAFALYRRLRPGTLHAGEYRFDHPATLPEVYDRIRRGDVYTFAVTIPEGYNLYEIADAVQRAGLGTADAFFNAARHDTALIRDLSPDAPSLEGYLFPDTYRFNRHATPQQMLTAMVKRFRQAAAQLGLPPGPAGARIVTLASLIEKEVRVDSERPLVAGVFTNRLAKGIPLATDPTVVYAALREHRWRGVIHQSDLAFDSPWNTYRHPGLPPGPIASPGLAALRAAMHPAKTDFIYFVADAQGHSRFSVDLAQHNQQVQAYRQAQQAVQPATAAH